MTGGSHIHPDKYLGVACADCPRGRCYSGPKTRGRGCLKGYKASIKRIKSGSQKLKINFDSLLGGPYGENSRTFVDEIVMFTRKKAPLIGVQSWKDVKDTVKIAIVEDMLVSQVFCLAKCYEFSICIYCSICLSIQTENLGLR